MTTLRRSFSLDTASVSASRGFVRDATTGLPPGIQEAALLMVSELATNAIVHAVTGFEVKIDHTKSRLRVEVADLGGGEPELRSPTTSEVHGRGLQIVEELSDQWGIAERAGDRGKTVWYEVDVGPGKLPEHDDATADEAHQGQTETRSRSAPRRSAVRSGQSERSRSDRPKSSSGGSAHARTTRRRHPRLRSGVGSVA
jgi:anti-sigma regulatory factor (Ser/Thr protein kinase)